MITSFLYDPSTEQVREGLTLEEIRSALGNPDQLLWLDMENPTEEDYHLLKEPFRFHPLLIGDCLTPQNQPKCDEMEDYIFLVLHSVYYYVTKREEEALNIREIDIFAGKNYVMTIHNGHIKSVTVNREICRKTGKNMHGGSDQLLYHILDTMIDNYVAIIDTLTDKVDALEDAIITKPRQDLLTKILAMKRNIMTMRKVLFPQLELVFRLGQGKISFIQPDALMYFKDIYNHMSRITNLVENLREMGQSLFEAYHSSLANRLNDVMKVLTVIMTVMMPMTLVSGIGGMNVLFPFALRETLAGFWTLVSIMIIAGIILFIWFKKIKLI